VTRFLIHWPFKNTKLLHKHSHSKTMRASFVVCVLGNISSMFCLIRTSDLCKEIRLFRRACIYAEYRLCHPSACNLTTTVGFLLNLILALLLYVQFADTLQFSYNRTTTNPTLHEDTHTLICFAVGAISTDTTGPLVLCWLQQQTPSEDISLSAGNSAMVKSQKKNSNS
jgi:hypothetical protein